MHFSEIKNFNFAKFFGEPDIAISESGMSRIWYALSKSRVAEVAPLNAISGNCASFPCLSAFLDDLKLSLRFTRTFSSKSITFPFHRPWPFFVFLYIYFSNFFPIFIFVHHFRSSNFFILFAHSQHFPIFSKVSLFIIFYPSDHLLLTLNFFPLKNSSLTDPFKILIQMLDLESLTSSFTIHNVRELPRFPRKHFVHT